MFKPFDELEEEVQDLLLYGTDEEIIFKYNDGFRGNAVKKSFEGVIEYLENKAKKNRE